MACNGLGAFEIATRYEWKHSTKIGYFDMTSCLHQLLRKSILSWKFRDMQGYQDEIMDVEDVGIWE